MAAGALSLDEARRIALAAQGFDRPRPAGAVGRAHLRGVIRRLGLIQIDFVNVLVPAHYLVPFSRLGPYERRLLDDLVYRRREFTEQWLHEASIVPMETWPLLRHRMRAHRVRPWGFEKHLAANRAYAREILAAIRRRGPLAADEMPDPPASAGRIADRWGFGQAARRQFFEAHFGFGRLAVADRRRDFARVYDLAARVIPQAHRARRVSRAEAQRELILRAARAHGVAVAADLADYLRMPLAEARMRVEELAAAGRLRPARVEGWREPAVLHPAARRPERIDAAALISPFDPVIWTRPRVARLFGFDYRHEIFIPEARRRWGYYVLPFLLGDRLVARVDLKAGRSDGILDVRSAHLETGADPQQAARALARELRTLAAWLGLAVVRVGRRGSLARALATEVSGRSA